MKTVICILLTLTSLTYSFGQKSHNETEFEIMAEKIGDLDNDGIDEKVIVYETNEEVDYRKVREIKILKYQSGKWTEWRKSKNAILKYGAGGLLGEAFEGIDIENGILKIYFFGGSRSKWSYTDKYRFQNNQFELIGYTHEYFILDEFWETNDFNLSTGKFISKKRYEEEDPETGEVKILKTENETFYKKGIVITLKNRNTKEIIIKTPKYNREIYLAQIDR